MTKEQLLAVRDTIKKRKPTFIRQDAHKVKRVHPKWRKPKGLHSKMRHNFKGHRRSIEVGWKSPQAVAGLSSKGFVQVLVHTIAEVEKIKPKIEAIIIASGVSLRRRLELMELAVKKGITVLNFRDPQKYLDETRVRLAKQKEEHAQRKNKQATKKKEPLKKKPQETTIEETVESEDDAKIRKKKELDKELVKVRK